MTDAPLDLDALEALRDEMFAAMRATNLGEFSIRQMNAEEKYDDAIRNAATALIAMARERDRLVTKPKVACPIALEHDHWICSAGICVVCQDDLRKQIGIRDTEITHLREALEAAEPFIEKELSRRNDISMVEDWKEARDALAKVRAALGRETATETPP